MSKHSIVKPSYIDLFKRFRVFEMENIDKMGNVKIIQDQTIVRKVIQIQGEVSAKNFIQIPGKKSIIKSLDIYGRYIYIFASFPQGSITTFSLEFKTNNKKIDFSFSNLFKNFKVLENSLLQIPLRILNNKWTILAIDIKSFLEGVLKLDFTEFYLLSFKICSNIYIKNIIASNSFFNFDEIPNELKFKSQKNESFLDSYNFIFLQDELFDSKKNNILIEPKIKKENKENIDNKENINFTNNKQLNKKPSLKLKKVRFSLENEPKKKHNDLEIENIPEPISTIPIPTSFSSINQLNFELEPIPIMNLNHIHGYSGLYKTLTKINENKIIYSIGNKLILLDLKKKTQKFFFANQNDIKHINFSNFFEMIFSIDNQFINISDLNNFEQKIGSVNSGLKNIICSDIGYTNTNLINIKKKNNENTELKLILAGEDEKNRISIQIYSFNIHNSSELQLYHKQISDWDIKKIGFIDKDDSNKGIVTLGKDNIRVWKLKDHTFRVLNGSNIYISSFVKNSYFTDFIIVKENFIEKALISNNIGNIFIIDLIEKEMISLFKISDESIITLSFEENQNLIACSLESGKINIFTIDFNETILEGKLESQALKIDFLQDNTIMCGCINGTIGFLKIQEKKFVNLIRTHTDEIIMIDYNKNIKKLITVSIDFTIRIWSIDSGVLDQIYEFRCLEEEITFLKSFNENPWIICGFGRGNMRIFDLKNYTILSEIEKNHKNEINSIDIQISDKRFLSSDLKSDQINLFVETNNIGIFELCKSFPKTNMNNIQMNKSLGFDYFDRYFYIIVNSGYTINIYSLKTLEIQLNIECIEQIYDAFFTYHPSDFFIINNKGNLLKYDVNYSYIEFSRQYSKIHENKIYSIDFSKNNKFIISVGEDNYIKVWDYQFRGNISPNYQCFNPYEKINQIIFSNDENDLVFAFGKNSKCLFLWKFHNKLCYLPEDKIDFFDKKVNKNNKNEPFFERNNLSIMINCDSSQKLEEKNDKFDVKKQENEEEKEKIQIEKNYEEIKELEYNNKIYNESKEEIINEKEDNLQIEKIGKYFSLNSFIGYKNFTSELNKSLFISNSRANYLAFFSSNNLIITYMTTPKTQKIYTFNDIIISINISSNEKFLSVSLNNSKIIILDAINFQKLNKLIKNKSIKILTLDFSYCNTYILSIYQLENENQPYICIWEIASGALIVCSVIEILNLNDIYAKWKPNSLEFFISDRKNLVFWRLNSKHSLDYQLINFNDIENYGFFSTFLFIDLENLHLLIIGTVLGSLIIIDSRSGGLICICSNLFPTSILQILSNNLYTDIYFRTNSPNIYHWDFSKINTIEQIIKKFDEKPDILSLDSYTSHSVIMNKLNEKNLLIFTKTGFLWYCDFIEMTTIRLLSTHIKQITNIKMIFDEKNNQKIIISSSNDNTIKFWDFESLEIIVEMFFPRKECLSFDINIDLGFLIAGFNDGTISLFNYRENKNYGSFMLVNQKKEINAIKIINNNENFLIGTNDGELFMVYVENWNVLKINIGKIIDEIDFGITCLEIDEKDELNNWVIGGNNGRIMVYNRKDLSRTVKKSIRDVEDIQTYLIDNYKFKINKKFENSIQKTSVKFSLIQQSVYIALNSLSNSVIIRNYKEHINLRVIELELFPISFCQSANGNILYISDEKGGISTYDFNIGMLLDRYDENKNGKNIFQCLDVWDIRKKKLMQDLVGYNEKLWNPFFITTSNNEIWIWNLLK